MKLPFKLLLLVVTIPCLLVASNHTKNYEVVFNLGSVAIDNEVQIQISNIYNEVPELNYADIHVSGLEEDQYPSDVEYKLGKQRAKNVLAFLIEVGVSKRNVKLLYNKQTSVLLFKPKSKLILSEVMKSSAIEEGIQLYQFKCKENYSFISKHKVSYQITNNTFCEGSKTNGQESDQLILKLTESISCSEIVQMGIQGGTDVPVGKTLLVAHLGVQGIESHKVIAMKPHQKIRVVIPSDSVISNLILQKGRVDENQIFWTKSINNRPFCSREWVDNEGVRQLVVHADITDTGYFRICSLPSNERSTRAVKIAVDGNEELQIYAYSPNLDLLVPAYQNTGYFNRYEFAALEASSTWLFIAVSKGEDASFFLEQEIDLNSLNSDAVLNLNLEKCELGVSGDCVSW